jgi:hypothetical protein
MMVAARVDVGWIAVESEKASTRLLKILRIVAMKRIFRRRRMIMNDLTSGANENSRNVETAMTPHLALNAPPVDLAGQAEMGLCATFASSKGGVNESGQPLLINL